MKVEPIILSKDIHIQKLLEYYMGKNTPQRQDFIIGNLRMEIDRTEQNGLVA
jgi:topoisomerase-4 subunit B